MGTEVTSSYRWWSALYTALLAGVVGDTENEFKFAIASKFVVIVHRLDCFLNQRFIKPVSLRKN